MKSIAIAKEAILKQFAQEIYWVYPYLIYELKEEFSDFPEDELDQTYFNKSKINIAARYRIDIDRPVVAETDFAAPTKIFLPPN